MTWRYSFRGASPLLGRPWSKPAARPDRRRHVDPFRFAPAFRALEPWSKSHTFLARILQKWYTSDTISKNLASILEFRQTCQILADQTFLADSDVSCKILAGQNISCKILGLDKVILQENVWNVRKTSRLFHNFEPRKCSK